MRGSAMAGKDSSSFVVSAGRVEHCGMVDRARAGCVAFCSGVNGGDVCDFVRHGQWFVWVSSVGQRNRTGFGDAEV